MRIATGFGLGYAPIAPGTFGSLGGLLLVVLFWSFGGAWGVVAGAVVVTGIGYWAAGAGPSRFGHSDPGPVVIDEIAGQMVSLLLIAPSVPTLISGFLLFRLFDIWKPYPAWRVEKLPGASGIMTDDLVAGVYANIVQQAVTWGVAGWWGSA